MRIISFDMLKKLDISLDDWYNWSEIVIKNKNSYLMTPKSSIHYGSSFLNTMPSVLPDVLDNGVMGVKVVNRYLERIPSLDSQILLYDFKTGKNLAIMDGNLITTMRTAAVAVHSVDLFARSDFYEIGMLGFGNIGHAFLRIFLDHFKNKRMKIKLLRYKDHAEKVLELYGDNNNVTFEIVDDMESLITNSDIIVSAITYTDEILGKDEWFKEGCLIVPIHQRGFQNCDLFFDKIYGDETGQISVFKYFDKFKSFAEVTDVVNGKKVGRENDKERIIAYNSGISIQDIYAAAKIYEMIKNRDIAIEMKDFGPKEKYWIL